jgi:hypothetical protein
MGQIANTQCPACGSGKTPWICKVTGRHWAYKEDGTYGRVHNPALAETVFLQCPDCLWYDDPAVSERAAVKRWNRNRKETA